MPEPTPTSPLSAGLQHALQTAGLRPVDSALADWGWRHGGGQAGALALALTSYATGLGHTCLPIAEPEAVLGEAAALVEHLDLPEALRYNPLVGAPESTTARPLVLDGAKLYLQRYWDYERRLAERLRVLTAAAPEVVNPAALGPDGGLFDHAWSTSGEPDWQAIAAFVAQRHRFTVISGGPGTGKTYTIVRLILCLIDAALASASAPPTFALAAPTGKAAARMTAAIDSGLNALQPAATVQHYLPRTATTLHRLLRLNPLSTIPGRDRQRPLAADVIIVDEASMVDLPLMTKLAEAVRDDARLVLLGDRYQLASVESGAVLADLCSAAGINRFSEAQHNAAAPLFGNSRPRAESSPLGDHVVTLQTSHRFQADSPIGKLAAAINSGETVALQAALSAEDDTLIATSATDEAALQRLTTELTNAYAPLFEAAEPVAALEALERVRLLTGTRVGPLGSNALNHRVARSLGARYGFDAAANWYHARPIMITVNSPQAALYNGDTGVLWREPDGTLRAWFRTETGLRALRPALLPAHTNVYAMTIHKAQGSELEHIYLTLPQADSPVLTRELLYTGVTRARQRLRVVGDWQSWRQALARSTQRYSGLAARLGNAR